MKRLLVALVLFVVSSFVLAAVNINTATKEQLDALPGIGPVKAQAIIDYRNANGPFKTPDDIMKVKGIKEGEFAKIKDQIAVSGATAAAAPAKAEAAKTPAPAATRAAPAPAATTAPAPAVPPASGAAAKDDSKAKMSKADEAKAAKEKAKDEKAKKAADAKAAKEKAKADKAANDKTKDKTSADTTKDKDKTAK